MDVAGIRTAPAGYIRVGRKEELGRKKVVNSAAETISSYAAVAVDRAPRNA
jgi:hypothetical protein